MEGRRGSDLTDRSDRWASLLSARRHPRNRGLGVTRKTADVRVSVDPHARHLRREGLRLPARASRWQIGFPFLRVPMKKLRLPVSFLAAASLAAAAVYTDVEYSNVAGESLRLDAWVPDGAGPHAAAILVHGGGWTAGDKSGGPRKALIAPLHEPLQQAGLAWFSINYRLAPQHPYPACLDDVLAAIRWVKAHAAEYRIDPSRLALAGESAGGHLVALAAVRAEAATQVAAVVPFYGRFDLTDDLKPGDALRANYVALFGRAVFDEPAQALMRAASPLHFIKPGLPPFLLVHGTADTTVPYEQSVRLQASLRAQRVPCDFLPIEGGAHGMLSWNKVAPGYRQQVAAWIVKTLAPPTRSAPVRLFDEAPVEIRTVAPGVRLVDFGRVAFGNLRLAPPAGASGGVTIHFGEALTGGRINRRPPGTVRYAQSQVTLTGNTAVVAAPPADKRNTTQPAAVLTPPAWGVILPFRWVEIEGWPGELHPEHLRRQSAFAATWDDQAAAFRCSDELLNRIWELCRYSIKATTFAGVYVDGDRERIPYEADAYLNQLSHYATDRDVQMARDSYDWLMKQPTWPTEWAAHMVFMAHADWMHTGDTAWLAARYAALKSKLLPERTRPDGLLGSNEAQMKKGDLVDWPPAERDGFVFKPVNSVVNAFQLRALALMAELARALQRDSDAAAYLARERATRAVFQEKFFDAARGAYRDGEGTDHASQHASLFPLAFGLAPPEHRARVTAWVASRGMACSVYAAQYLLEGLFENEQASPALALITAPTDRSWKHMIESGTTISWEAWDQKYKPNQDWNHAWGAAPANLFPRFILGVRPLTPGWGRAVVRPHPGALTQAEGKIPTPRGPILINWTRATTFKLSLTLPTGMTARLELPATETSRDVLVGSQPARATRAGARWLLDDDVSGHVTIEVR